MSYSSESSTSVKLQDQSSSSAHVKLWVGNLPHKLTEYQLLKVLEKFGTVSQFDFLYNISETGKRTPRGYAFVTFSSQQSAENAIKSLNKTEVLGRDILVRLANPKTDPDYSSSNRKIIPAALKAGSKQSLTSSQKVDKIKQLEEKLKRMEKSTTSEFKIVTSPSKSNARPCPYSKPSSSKK